MKKIEINSVRVINNTIHYQIKKDKGLGLLKQDVVDLFVRYDSELSFKLSDVPTSLLAQPIVLYMLPITFFYKIELVIPEMDKNLYDRIPDIYEAYSRIYGPFKEEWKGKLNIGEIIENKPLKNAQYDKVVFFSGGVDACHAGINNAGKRTLLVSIPDIENNAKNEGPLREQKYALIKDFSNVVKSDWLLISNNFNQCLFDDKIVYAHLEYDLHLSSPAFMFDGWYGIKYLANMCTVAPIGYLTGIKKLVMGSSYEQIEDDCQINLDGANPELTDAIRFANITFAEQDGLMIRRSKKVSNIIQWCRLHGIFTRLWACFADKSIQCGYCRKCVRTQLNILCTGENPKDWGFENFSEIKFDKYIKSFRYFESNPCWLWDIVDSIDNDKTYPYCNDTLHWLKNIGYKEYSIQSLACSKPTFLQRLISFNRYSHYVIVLFSKLKGKSNEWKK